MTPLLLLHPSVTLDRYKLEHQLGAGGQGQVWKAFDTTNDLAVALKIVPRPQGVPFGVVEPFVERARHEASALLVLDHPSLVKCRRFIDDTEQPVLVLVLEWVEGTSAERALLDPRFSPTLRETLLHHIAHGLAYLHGKGIVHRDIKLENIVISERFWSNPADPSTVKLVDLGIAVPQGNPRNLTGGIIGTPAYMSPERLDPDFWGSPSTYAADVFALGVLGWILLTGSHPTGFRGASFQTFIAEYQRIYNSRQAWPSTHIPGIWDDVLRRCLSIDFSMRPASGTEVVHLLSAPTAAHADSSRVAPGGSTSTLSPPAALSAGPRSAPTSTATIPAGMVPPALTPATLPWDGARDGQLQVPASSKKSGSLVVLVMLFSAGVVTILALAAYLLSPTRESSESASPGPTSKPSPPTTSRDSAAAPTVPQQPYDGCRYPFVNLYTRNMSDPAGFDYPLTRAALKGHTEFSSAEFVEVSVSNKRVFGARFPEGSDWTLPNRLVEVITAGVVGSSPVTRCFKPESVRVLKIDLRTGELLRLSIAAVSIAWQRKRTNDNMSVHSLERDGCDGYFPYWLGGFL